MIYPLHTVPDDNGTILITCPVLPEVTTFAETEDDIERNAADAIEEAIAARIHDGRPVPEPQSTAKADPRRDKWVHLPLMTALKVELYLALRNSPHIRTRAELARRMNKPREQIDRLFRLDHASRTDQIESAFKALDIDIDVRLAPAAAAGPRA